MLPLLLLSSLPWSFRNATTSRAWRRALSLLLAGLYLLNLLLQVNWALYWIDPDHWLIAGSIGLVAARGNLVGSRRLRQDPCVGSCGVTQQH